MRGGLPRGGKKRVGSVLSAFAGPAVVFYRNRYGCRATAIGDWGESDRAGRVWAGIVDCRVGDYWEIARGCSYTERLRVLVGWPGTDPREINRLQAGIDVHKQVANG